MPENRKELITCNFKRIRLYLIGVYCMSMKAAVQLFWQAASGLRITQLY